ncbi:MAG: 2TM domain-containing protein [Chloroflexota bacterium]
MQEAEQYDAIRRQVEQRFQQRYAFYTHVGVYTLVSLVLWAIYAITAGLAWEIADIPVIGGLVPFISFPWPLIIMAAWGIGLIAHGMNYYIRYGEGAIRRREAINREVERQMALNVGYEKPKNDIHMRLTDDGELEVIDDEPVWPLKHKHQ